MKNTAIIPLIFLIAGFVFAASETRPRLREFGLKTGVMQPGRLNAITDVKGVAVGQVTLIKGENIRTGVTAVLPYSGNIYQAKVPGAVYVANGYGKLTGYTQIEELGNKNISYLVSNRREQHNYALF